MAGDLLINAKRPPRIHVEEREFSKEGNEPSCKANKKDNFISPAPIPPLAIRLMTKYKKRFKQPKNHLSKFGMSKIQIITKSRFLIK